MNKLILAAILAYAPFAISSELDDDMKPLSPGHVTQADSTSVGPAVADVTGLDVPKTLIIRRDVKTGEVTYLPVEKVVPADKQLAAKLEKAPFQGVDKDMLNEADTVSSTSSWGFGFRRPFGFGFSRPFYGFGGFRPWVNSLAPYWAYNGYNVAYNAYYGYQTQDYQYAYCQPQTFAAQCATPCYRPGYDNCCGGGGGGWRPPYYGGNPGYWTW